MIFNLIDSNNLMEKYKLDALLFIDPSSLSYFGYDLFFNSARGWMLKPGGTNNYGVINFCILPYKKKPIYIINAFNVSSLQTKIEETDEVVAFGPFTDIYEIKKSKDDFKNVLDSRINQIFKINIFNNRLEALGYVLKKYNLLNSKIALEEDGIDTLIIREIKDSFKSCKFFNGSEIIRLIRMIKTDEEINIIGECFRITEEAFIKSIKSSKPKSNLGSLKNNFRFIIEKENASYEHFFLMPDGLGMTDQNSYIIEKDKIMGFDSGIVFNGYISDTGLTLFNGRYKRKDLEAYKKLLDIINEGVELVKPGINCSEIYKTMDKKRNQYNLLNTNFECHGVGRSFREYPIINGNLDYTYNNGFENVNADFIIVI